MGEQPHCKRPTRFLQVCPSQLTPSVKLNTSTTTGEARKRRRPMIGVASKEAGGGDVACAVSTLSAVMRLQWLFGKLERVAFPVLKGYNFAIPYIREQLRCLSKASGDMLGSVGV